MIKRICTEEFLEHRDQQTALIDVRSPSEYAYSHIPGAINIPLFTDEEREIVGTKYKQINKESALHAGLDFVGPRLTSYLKQLKRITRKKEVLIYCWRGGMRSGNMAWLFELGEHDCLVLDGGYKAYRNFVQNSFDQEPKLVVLGGMTGSGKSEVLEEIQKLGTQIIHLEELANHKGSAFGALGQKEQPTPIMFENLLFEEWRNLDFSKILLVEDESAAIGKVSIPKSFFKQMRLAPVVRINLPRSERVKRIMQEYAGFDAEDLKAAIRRIFRRLGDLDSRTCITAIDAGNLEEAVDVSLNYYDKAYENGMTKRIAQSIHVLELQADNSKKNAISILQFLDQHLEIIK